VGEDYDLFSHAPANRTADYNTTFIFTANDGVSDSNEATITLTVAADNDPRVALGSTGA
jgi:hypothetical protein